jgi:nucleoside-diphosphate-sugar epimerase
MTTNDFNPVLVTGGAGFIGAAAIERLLEGGIEVHALLRPDADTWRLREVLGRVRRHDVDVVDADGVASAIRAARPAAVVHLATHGAYESQGDARRILATNVLGTFNLLESSLSAGVKVFVNAGSSSEYGGRREPMREADRLQPNSVYAVAKAAQTHLAALMAAQGPTAVVTFRLFSAYGPWEEPTRLLPTIIRRARAGLPLEMASPETARDFVYIDDVLRALLDFAPLRASSGEVFNLGSGVQSTLRDVVAAVQDVVGRRSPVQWGAMPSRGWDTDRWQADIGKVRQALGWSPRYSLPEGVARMAEWMERAGVAYATA